jgi:glycosyltransferase involved in cell wall biosynthesis
MEKANELFHTDSQEYRSSIYKFAICMATYKRANGNSLFYLQRSLQSILNQTASNWHIFLVGDKYEDQEEFDRVVAGIPSNHITAVNLPVAPEREHIQIKEHLWKVAGANAFNHAHRLALNDGYDYMLHLDDDDCFHPKKIQILNYVISLTQIPPMFMFHSAEYINGLIIPRILYTNSLHANNSPPYPEDCIHSSYCIHRSLLENFSFSGWNPNAPFRTDYLEGDKQCLYHVYRCLYRNPDSVIDRGVTAAQFYHANHGDTIPRGHARKHCPYLPELSPLKDDSRFPVYIPLTLCEHKIERESLQ